MHGDARLQLLNRNHAPRADRVVVGAPPASVEAGLPGARDEVRAYAARIGAAWRAFMATDVQPWAQSVGLVGESGYPKEIEDEWGDYANAPSGPTKKEKAAFFAKLRADHYAFDSYRGQIESFDLLGPTASEAWQRLQLFEKTLHGDVAAWEAISGKQATAKPPKELELAGGVQQTNQTASTIKTVAVAAAVAAVAIGVAVAVR